MLWLYLVLALALLGVNNYLVFKFGQKTVVKAFEKFHLIDSISKNIRSDFATFFMSVKRDLHL